MVKIRIIAKVATNTQKPINTEQVQREVNRIAKICEFMKIKIENSRINIKGILIFYNKTNRTDSIQHGPSVG